jgi:hypothetical protein
MAAQAPDRQVLDFAAETQASQAASGAPHLSTDDPGEDLGVSELFDQSLVSTYASPGQYSAAQRHTFATLESLTPLRSWAVSSMRDACACRVLVCALMLGPAAVSALVVSQSHQGGW